ncbi:unnamed protein product, partial [Ectocarpus sp. 12 AP-2014]
RSSRQALPPASPSTPFLRARHNTTFLFSFSVGKTIKINILDGYITFIPSRQNTQETDTLPRLPRNTRQLSKDQHLTINTTYFTVNGYWHVERHLRPSGHVLLHTCRTCCYTLTTINSAKYRRHTFTRREAAQPNATVLRNTT